MRYKNLNEWEGLLADVAGEDEPLEASDCHGGSHLRQWALLIVIVVVLYFFSVRRQEAVGNGFKKSGSASCHDGSIADDACTDTALAHNQWLHHSAVPAEPIGGRGEQRAADAMKLLTSGGVCGPRASSAKAEDITNTSVREPKFTNWNAEFIRSLFYTHIKHHF